MPRPVVLFFPLPTNLHWYGQKHHLVAQLQVAPVEGLPERLLQFLSFFFLATFSICFFLSFLFFSNDLTAQFFNAFLKLCWGHTCILEGRAVYAMRSEEVV